MSAEERQPCWELTLPGTPGPKFCASRANGRPRCRKGFCFVLAVTDEDGHVLPRQTVLQPEPEPT